MSLNRHEQTLYDYIKGHPDERQYWQDKVRGLFADSNDIPGGVSRIDTALWRYFEERSAVVPSFGVTDPNPGAQRTSMKNLAELLIRLWTEPRPRKPATPEYGPSE